MSEFTIHTIDGKSVSFTGELVQEATRAVEFPDDFKRKFELRLYRVDGGGFVPTIDYKGDAPGERTGCVAEMVDLDKDIDNFYFVFVPEDLLPAVNRSNRDEADYRRRLSLALRRAYESASFAFLDALKELLEQPVPKAGPEAEAPADTTGAG